MQQILEDFIKKKFPMSPEFMSSLKTIKFGPFGLFGEIPRDFFFCEGSIEKYIDNKHGVFQVTQKMNILDNGCKFYLDTTKLKTEQLIPFLIKS